MMMYIHDDKEEGVDIGCVLFLSSSSRLFIYIFPYYLLHCDISCLLDNRYFGHNNHHVYLYIRRIENRHTVLEISYYKQ